MRPTVSVSIGVLLVGLASTCSSSPSHPVDEVDSPPSATAEPGPSPAVPAEPTPVDVTPAVSGSAGAGGSSAAPGPSAPGLKGKVTFVGKVCPPKMGAAIKTPPCNGPYAGYEVIVFKPDGKTEVGRARTAPNGEYELSLEPGKYVVFVQKGPKATNRDKREVDVGKGPTSLDLLVDTGVR